MTNLTAVTILFSRNLGKTQKCSLNYFKHLKFQNLLLFTEIGIGWQPTVLDSQEEYDFIRQDQKGFSNSVRYWIGGSTNISSNNTVDYSNYIANNSGKIKTTVTTI